MLLECLVLRLSHPACVVIIQELEKRFYSGSSSAEAGKAAKAAAADFAVLAGFLSQRGWATLTVPSSNSSSGGTGGVKLTEADYRELDSQLDEVSMPRIMQLVDRTTRFQALPVNRKSMPWIAGVEILDSGGNYACHNRAVWGPLRC